MTNIYKIALITSVSTLGYILMWNDIHSLRIISAFGIATAIIIYGVNDKE